jgi:SagB-type dehydrogenase family enzyme
VVKPRLPTGELRPLASQAPRSGDGELVFESPSRRIAIEGDLDLVREVVARCDGRRTVAEISAELGADRTEVEELVEGLIEAGVATDGASAWERFHRESSVGSGLARPLGDRQLEELMRERFEAEHGERFEPLLPRSGAIASLAARRRSAEAGTGERTIGFEELSSLLSAVYGDRPGTARPIPSAGAIYPLAFHVLLRRPVPPLGAGLWWYEPGAEGLWLVRDRDLDADGLLLPHPKTDPLVALGHPIVFLSADFERSGRKYSNRGYRFALIEAGAAMQNAYLLAAELELPIRCVGGIIEAALDPFLDLPEHAHSLLALLLGN